MPAQGFRHEDGVPRALERASKIERHGRAPTGEEDVCHDLYRQEREGREENS